MFVWYRDRLDLMVLPFELRADSLLLPIDVLCVVSIHTNVASWAYRRFRASIPVKAIGTPLDCLRVERKSNLSGRVILYMLGLMR